MEELISKILSISPEDPLSFIIEFLKNKTGYVSLNEQESEELKRLRIEVKKLEKALASQ